MHTSSCLVGLRSFFFWICLSLMPIPSTEGLECGPNESSLNEQRCCSLCPPGEGATEPCTHENNTLCNACSLGSTFSASPSYSDSCQTCSTCAEYSRAVTSCSLTQDTVCECENGYFFDSLLNKCRQCDQCHVGYGIRRPCVRLQNTVCSKCPDGSFSDLRSTTACSRCSTCGTNEITLQPCTAVQNTICIDIPYLAYDPSASAVTQAAVSERTKEATPEIIPILCSLLGLIVAVTVIWAIVKARRHRTKSSQSKQTPHSVGSHEVQGQVFPLVSRVTEEPNYYIAPNNIEVTPDSVPVTKFMRYEALPVARRFAVENLLQHSPDSATLFKYLATELGYPAELLVREKSPQFRTLLTSWAQNKASTVGVLAQALSNVGRVDVFAVLFHPLLSHDDCRSHVLSGMV